MAVAGGTVPAILMRLDGTRLVSLGQHRPFAFVAVGVDEAITKLRKGQSVYLELYADNVQRVKAAFAPAQGE
jgi:hypothetical protein